MVTEIIMMNGCKESTDHVVWDHVREGDHMVEPSSGHFQNC